MTMSLTAHRGSPGAVGSLHKATVLFGAAIGMAVGFSAAYFSTLSVFLKPLAGAFGWTRGQASAVAVLAQLGLALGAPVLGQLIERYGAQRVVPASVATFALGLMALPSVPGSVPAFGAAALLMGLFAVGTTPAGYLGVLPPIFDRRLGFALGLAMVGLGVGNAVMPMLAQGWIAEFGWQRAYRHLGVTVAISGAIACLLLFWPSARSRGPDDATRQVHAVPPVDAQGLDLRGALREWRFWLIVVTLFAVSAAGLGGMVHLVPLLTDRGMPGEQAARMAGVVGMGVLLGRLVTGVLIDVVHARFVAAAAFAAGATGLLMIAYGPPDAKVFVATGALLFAFAIGAEGDFIPFFVRRYFGIRCFSSLYGVLFLVFALGGVVGPLVFGMAFDRTGDYVQVCEAAAVVCGVSALGVLALGRYTYQALK